MTDEVELSPGAAMSLLVVPVLDEFGCFSIDFVGSCFPY
jgi:hypothetical protein